MASERATKSPVPTSPRSEKGGDALAAVMDSALSVADETVDEPPPYDDAGAPVQQSADRMPEVMRMYRRLEQVPWNKYMPPGAQISKDGSTVTIANMPKDHDPGMLSKLVTELVALPPLVKCRILGQHQGWTSSEKDVDFDLTLNLTPYILGQDTFGARSIRWTDSTGQISRSCNRHSIAGEINMAVASCYRDSEKPQSITIERLVPNLDKEYITNRIYGLLGTLRYKGDISITFPTAQSNVVIDLPFHDPGRERRGFFGNIIKDVTSTKQTCAIRVNWPYASRPGPGEEIPERSDVARSFLSKSETMWFAEWEAVIRRAIVKCEKTVLGVDAWVQNMTAPLTKAELPKADRAIPRS